MHIFEQLESEVRSYSRSFPAIFRKAKGAHVFDKAGKRYIDFFSGAGALNYGHNPDRLKDALVRYLMEDGIVHSLDMATEAKERFLERFRSVILEPRHLDYKVQFTGPTGTNAVEAAFKLARKIKRRSNIVAFTNGYHGLTLGALAATGNRHFRNEAFINRQNVSFLPFDGYFGSDVDTIAYLRKLLEDDSSGLDLPAAIVLETVQAEGGINVASEKWLRGLSELCRRFDILLIVDDIQVGVGRTGPFFSFEDAGIVPDLVTLSKSISGVGLPMAIVLLKPELDQWLPAEHTGTFRGNNLAFVGAAEALVHWETDELSRSVQRKSEIVREALGNITRAFPHLGLSVRGKGLIYGLQLPNSDVSGTITRDVFQRGLIMERCGARGTVLKILPPLVIEDEVLRQGLGILEESIFAHLPRVVTTAE
ncbi:MAG TPA: diaminobutyrate--2-oxoglutarate transaminase [Polyangium sp.]|nr:diaminobutyrate--2-oxoglutarate transaminase [Polyangium sp.]